MKLSRRQLLLALATAAALPGTRAAERPWPDRPLRIIVPGAAGGLIDIRARWLADRLAPALGQPVIVDNRPGASGIIGTEVAAHSAADGYTIVVVHQGTMAVAPHLYSRLPYDPLADFTPITATGIGPLLLVVGPSIPATSVAELIALAKSKPGQLTFGSPGIGSPPHMASELLRRLAGISATHVPYKGGGNSTTDVIGGHITWTIDGLSLLVPHVKAGRLRALAVTGSQRLPVLPDVPTMVEAGLPGYEYTAWMGIAAPAGTPEPIVSKLNREIVKALDSAEGRELLASGHFEMGPTNPRAFAGFIHDEHAKWGSLVREAGLKAE